MKKVIKWTLFSLILGGIVALSLCYIIIPERTRVAIDIVVDYLNRPLFIGCGCTITGGLVLGIIIKYVLKATKINIKEDLEETKKFNAEVVVNAQNYYEKALQKEEEIKEICSHYEEEIIELKSSVLDICKTSPNKKINEIGIKLEDSLLKLEEDTQKLQTSMQLDFAKYSEEKHKVDELQDKINELTEKLERLVESNEENERIDSNPKEE